MSVIAKNNPVLTEASRKSLAEIGAASKKAVAGLVDLAGAKNPSEVRIAAINALAEMGSEANETIPDLIMILNDNDDDVHVAVVKALGKIGRASDSSVSDLVKLLKNKSDYVKMRAIAELSEMGKAASPAVSSLQQLARDSGDKEVRDEAKKAVEKISKAKR